METGIAGRHVVLRAAGEGIGKARAAFLAWESGSIGTVTGTKSDAETAADEIHASRGAAVTFVAADVTTAGWCAAIPGLPSRAGIHVDDAGSPPRSGF